MTSAAPARLCEICSVELHEEHDGSMCLTCEDMWVHEVTRLSKRMDGNVTCDEMFEAASRETKKWMVTH